MATVTIHSDFEAQEYWSGWLIPSPVDLPDPGMELESLALQADSLPSKPPGKESRHRSRHHIEKQRHHFASKGHIVNALVFPVVRY